MRKPSGGDVKEFVHRLVKGFLVWSCTRAFKVAMLSVLAKTAHRRRIRFTLNLCQRTVHSEGNSTFGHTWWMKYNAVCGAAHSLAWMPPSIQKMRFDLSRPPIWNEKISGRLSAPRKLAYGIAAAKSCPTGFFLMKVLGWWDFSVLLCLSGVFYSRSWECVKDLGDWFALGLHSICDSFVVSSPLWLLWTVLLEKFGFVASVTL